MASSRELELRRRACNETAINAARRTGWRAWAHRIGADGQTARGVAEEVTIVLVEHDMQAVSRSPTGITVLVYGRVMPPACRRRFAAMKRSSGPISAISMWWSLMADTASLLESDGIGDLLWSEPVLFGLSLSVRSARWLALMGCAADHHHPLLMGLTPARAGTIRFAGHEVRNFPSFRIAQLDIGLVPEAPDLSQFDGARKSGRRVRHVSAAPIPGPSKRSTRCSAPFEPGQYGRHAVRGEQQMLAMAAR